MALQTLFVLEGCVSYFPGLLMVELSSYQMNDDIFNAVRCFCVEKIECVMRCGQVTIHTVSYKPLPIVDVCRSLPSVIRELNFVARGTKLGCGGAHHGVVKRTEKGKSYDDTYGNKDRGLEIFWHR